MYLDYLDLVPEWNNDNFNDIEVEEWKQKKPQRLAAMDRIIWITRQLHG
jgi:hypothetical protein